MFVGAPYAERFLRARGHPNRPGASVIKGFGKGRISHTERHPPLPNSVTAHAGRVLCCRSNHGFRPNLLAEGMLSETIVWKRRSQPMQMTSPRAGLKEGSGPASGVFGLADFLWDTTRFARVTVRKPWPALVLRSQRMRFDFDCSFIKV